MKRLPFDWTTVYADTASAAKKWIPLTRMIRASDVKFARLNLEMLATDVDLRLLWGIQTATSETTLDQPVEKGPTLNGDGLKVANLLDLSANVDSKALVRAGVFTWSNAASPVLICGRITGEFEFDRY